MLLAVLMAGAFSFHYTGVEPTRKMDANRCHPGIGRRNLPVMRCVAPGVYAGTKPRAARAGYPAPPPLAAGRKAWYWTAPSPRHKCWARDGKYWNPEDRTRCMPAHRDNTSKPNSGDSRRNCSSSCEFPASAPIRPTVGTSSGPPNGSTTSSSGWVWRAKSSLRPAIPWCMPSRRRCRALRWCWSMGIMTSSPRSRSTCGFRRRSSRLAATGTSTPGGLPTTRGRCSPT